MESELKPKHQGSRQLFKNPVLEKLSRTHIAIPLDDLSFILRVLVVLEYYDHLAYCVADDGNVFYWSGFLYMGGV